MSIVYENNLKALKEKNEALWNAFVTYENNHSGCQAFVDTAKNGEQIVGYHADNKDYYLNSTYNPQREAEKLMNEFFAMPENSFVSVCGLANGEFARVFLQNNHDAAIYVYEPCVDVFSAVMHEIDITDLLSNRLFFLAVESLNEDDFGQFLFTYISQMNEYINRYMALPIYQKLFVDGYDHYSREIQNKYECYRIQINTWMKAGKMIGLAGIRNMRFLPGCRSGAEYQRIFPEELPAIIVAAGPSLQKNVELLKKAKGRAVIFVVDSAINTVAQHGIKPDFVVTVDTNKELKNFTAEGLADVFFLADATANTKVLEMVQPKNLVFYSGDSGTWMRMFAEQGSKIEEVYAGGSVALDAMAIAINWGFKRIIMIGQDLAMTGNRQYADGGELDVESKFNGVTLYVKDIYGNDVLTKKDYYTFIQEIEELAYKNTDIDFIDATEGGAFKKHTRIMTLQEAIDQYCTKEFPVEAIITSVPRLFAENGKQCVLDNLQHMEKDIIDLSEQMRNVAQECKLAAYMLEHKQYDKQKLKEINEHIRNIDEQYYDCEEYTLLKKVAAKVNYDYESGVYQAVDGDINESVRLYKNSEKMYVGTADCMTEVLDEIRACKQALES